MVFHRGIPHRVFTSSRPVGIHGLTRVLVLSILLVASGRATAQPPKLAFQTTTLPNGLRVVVHEDHSTPIVNVQLWYHAGSKNERPGRTGIAVLLERLMFYGSKNVKPGQHASLLSAAGGQFNADTTADVAVYSDTVPSSLLPLALWLEADRMASLRIERVDFAGERESLKEQRRLRAESQSYDRLPNIVHRLAFTVHPYRHPALGTAEDLDAATVEDVRDFFRTYYVPNNAVLVVAGDVDTTQVFDLASTYFGRVPKRGRSIPREIPAEPPSRVPTRVSLEENWPLPVVVVAHHVPADGDVDSYPLRLALKILTDGEGARLRRSLVYDTGMAVSAYADGRFTEHPNLFLSVAIVQPGFTTAQAEEALKAELAKLRQVPVSDRDLTRAKNQSARDVLLSLATVQQKAEALAHATVIRNDPAAPEVAFDAIQRVTAADIQRVAQQYLAPGSRLILTVVPKPATGERR